MISEFCDLVPPVYFQSFNVSELYLDRVATILLHIDQTTNISSLSLGLND
jgi:hypothetical protein